MKLAVWPSGAKLQSVLLKPQRDRGRRRREGAGEGGRVSAYLVPLVCHSLCRNTRFFRKFLMAPVVSMSMSSVVAAVVRGSVRFVVAAVMVRVVVVVVVIPNVDSVAAVLVAPFNLCLEVRSLAVFIALDGVIGVSASVAKVPSMRVGNTCVPDVDSND